MPAVEIREMDAATEYLVGTCTHVNETSEMDVCGQRRVAWLRRRQEVGLRVEVAFLDGEPTGFLYLMPIEVCPLGPLGSGLMVIPCLYVPDRAKGNGIGRALVIAGEKEARRQGKKGLVTVGFYHDFWLMPAPFFERCGFSALRNGEEEVLLWKVFDPSAEAPRLLRRNYSFRPVPDRVVVDLFWNRFCQTSEVEAERVREVAAELGEAVVLREYDADDRESFRRHQIPRGIFVDGKEIGWGYEAPKDGIREAIFQALKAKQSSAPGEGL